MSEPLTYESDQLIEDWRERFTGRRTVAHEMLEQAEVLVRHAVAREAQALRRDAATAAREAKTEREWSLERRERQVEFAERLQKSTEDRLRREVAELEQKLMQLSPRQTLMREERETVDQGTVIRLLAPKVPSYGDKESVRPWMLGEIEDVVHRLRMGGAEDGTELRFNRDAIEACVPFAEFALAPSSSRARSGLADLQDQLPESRPGGISFATLLQVGAGVALVLVVLLVKLVIL